MSSTKLITVLGATGIQGGSVASTFLASGWRVRAITRNPSSDNAKNLAGRGAEVVRADMDEPSTLAAAFEGSHVIFAVSDFWGLYNDPANKDKPKEGQSLNVWAGETETQQLKDVIDAAAKITTLERFVISTLSHVSERSKGKYTHVYHFDSKALAVEYGRETHPSLWAKTDAFQAGFFVSNFALMPMISPKKNAEGIVQFQLSLDGDVKLPFIAAEEDCGPIIKTMIESAPGKTVIAYREWLSMNELVKCFSEATGLRSEYVALPNGYIDPNLPHELAIEIAENLAYFKEFGYEGRDDPTVLHTQELSPPPRLGTVKAYFSKQDWSQFSK